jgi:hypothetical protein
VTEETLPAFFDLEASSLAEHSYPVELGVALPRQTGPDAWEIELRSWLVRPTTAWLAEGDAWSSTAEAIHGLSLERLLAEGLPPAEVAAALDAALAGPLLVSDTGEHGFDRLWLDRLADAAGEPWRSRGWPLSPLRSHELIACRARAAGISGQRSVMLLQGLPEATHAAAEDALRDALAWCDAASPRVPRRQVAPPSAYRRRWSSA